MLIGSVCMSHSPLIDRNRANPDSEAGFNAAVDKAASFVKESRPDLAVIIYPDHINGFFYNLLPSFCVGVAGTSIGDFGTAVGALDIPEGRALSLARSILDQGVDTAISYRMDVDHGAVQPYEYLTTQWQIPSIIPVFVNCAMAPRPTWERVRALGQAIGNWAREEAGERVLLIGSGGLSHDPPIPNIATASAAVRRQLIEGNALSHAQRHARQSRAMAEGPALAAGRSEILPLDPQWDRQLLAAFEAGDLSVLDKSSDEEITRTGGRGGHEVRSWVATLAAMGEGYRAETLFYEAIDEWITGMGIMTARPA